MEIQAPSVATPIGVVSANWPRPGDAAAGVTLAGVLLGDVFDPEQPATETSPINNIEYRRTTRPGVTSATRLR